ncbi:MAG: hypothetical protein HUU35_03255 [Armatimonadetes bacterium]|nr:hypothetical protein [Armatimonadota bacterium]
MPSTYKLVRLIRTASSECYLIWDNDNRVGQADIHYAEGLVHCTIILEQTLEREGVEALIEQLDDDVVSSYLPDFEREDFFVNVFSGEEILSYSDTEDDDTDTEDE